MTHLDHVGWGVGICISLVVGHKNEIYLASDPCLANMTLDLERLIMFVDQPVSMQSALYLH